MTDEDPDDESLVPSTVPQTCQLELRSFPDNPEWNLRFQQAMIELVIECGRFMDLSRLSAVTCGGDYDEALQSVDLGYESVVARRYTKTENLVGVAKVLRVKRDGTTMAHVVLNADFLTGLVSDVDEEWLFAANIVAHELSHVAAMSWLEQCSPGILLSQPEGDFAYLSLREAALAIWEEYAACRLSAPISNVEAVKERYAGSLETDFSDALERARVTIRAYRLHRDVSKLLVDLVGVLGNALKWTAYLAGHLDGAGSDEPIIGLAPSIVTGGFVGVVEGLVAALRSAWEKRLEWKDLDGLDAVIEALSESFDVVGAHLTLDRAGYSRIDVPYTAETMPNGESDMAKIAIEKGASNRKMAE